jgi:hypothetical protein
LTPEDVARKSIDAFNRQDKAAYAGLIAADAVVYDPIPGTDAGKESDHGGLGCFFCSDP